MYFSHNSAVIDYIINRIQDRIKTLQKNRLMFINTISVEELKQNKSIMIKTFLEIEDDMKQASQALSTLLIQNKDLVEEKENYDTIIRRYELRTLSLEKNIQEVNSKYEQLKRENEHLSMKLLENDRIIKENADRIHSFENMLEEKQEYNGYLENEVYNLKLQIQDKENYIKSLPNEGKFASGYADHNSLENKDIINNSSPKNNNPAGDNLTSNGFNHTFHNEEERKEQPEDFSYNVNNYLNERQNKKKLINEMIKEHLENTDQETPGDLKPIKENIDEEVAYEEDENSKKGRRDKLIIKINNTDGCLNFLEENLGVDFLSKLLSQNLNSSFLDKVQENVMNYEGLKNSGSHVTESKGNQNLRYGLNTNKKNNPFLNNLNHSFANNKEKYHFKEEEDIQGLTNSESKDVIEAAFKKSKDAHKKPVMHKSSSSKNFNSSGKLKEIFSPDKSFENSLRNYTNHPTRVFKNYSKPHGNFFDPKYQFGGESVLPSYKNPSRSRTLTNPNDSKDSIYKLTQNSNKV